MKLVFERVSFTYSSGVRALDKVNLAVTDGELVAIVGENGAGKTTLVKMLNGLLHPQEGRVLVGDWDTAEFTTAQLASRVSFLFQNPDDQLFERTVHREVAFGPRNLGFLDRKISANTRSALKMVGLEDRAETNPYDLEPNERKLLAFAATMAMDTPVLVLDEPSIGQDAKGRQRIGRIIRDLHKMGRMILLISHDLDFCAEYCERAIVMADGQILVDGSTSEVFSQSDVLSQAAVIPPQLIRLSQALKMHTAPLTVKQFVSDYAKWRKRKPK